MGESTSCTRGPAAALKQMSVILSPEQLPPEAITHPSCPQGCVAGAQAGGEQHREHYLHLAGPGHREGKRCVCVCVYTRACGGLSLQAVGHSCFSLKPEPSCAARTAPAYEETPKATHTARTGLKPEHMLPRLRIRKKGYN